MLESDTLKSVYYEVLVKSAEKVVGGATSITFEGSDVTSVTKEFELYNSDLELRRELVTIAREKDDLKYIIEIVSRQKLNGTRSEEHTSELQSRGNLVCRLLLEKKKEKK